MKKFMLTVTMVLSFGVAAVPAEAQSRPGGCLMYGPGGAVAGHFAGGHRIKGALAGCALGIYQRRKYEREVKEQNGNRNRNAERGRSPNQERANRSENRDRNADRSRAPSREGANRYDDLGLDLDRDRRTKSERADRPGSRTGKSSHERDGYGSGGSFARSQREDRRYGGNREQAPDPRWPGSYEPDETGSFPRIPGKVY